jgi:hypothetical protein
MANKEALVNIIKCWIDQDDQIKVLQAQIKEKREKRKKLTTDLVSIMKDNEIDCFDINSGKIMYCKNKSKLPLNKKTLHETLEKYFNDRPDIDVTLVRDYVLENRETKVTENIRRK